MYFYLIPFASYTTHDYSNLDNATARTRIAGKIYLYEVNFLAGFVRNCKWFPPQLDTAIKTFIIIIIITQVT